MKNHDPIKDITLGQIGKLFELLEPVLRKSGLQSEPSQQVLENQGSQVVGEMFAVFRKYVEASSNMILRHVAVSRLHSPQQAINATGRKKYCSDSVVNAMPQGEGDELDIFFFKPDASAYDKNGYISPAEVAKQFELRGLKPVDPYALAAFNEAEPAFADDYPNCTHWEDENGNGGHIAFLRRDDERRVGVRQNDRDLDDDWWFAGCRK